MAKKAKPLNENDAAGLQIKAEGLDSTFSSRPLVRKSDGNGRTARFLLNVGLVAGGLPWTVIPRDKKIEYFAALETAHTGGGIEKFAWFIYDLLIASKVAYDQPKLVSPICR